MFLFSNLFYVSVYQFAIPNFRGKALADFCLFAYVGLYHSVYECNGSFQVIPSVVLPYSKALQRHEVTPPTHGEIVLVALVEIKKKLV